LTVDRVSIFVERTKRGWNFFNTPKQDISHIFHSPVRVTAVVVEEDSGTVNKSWVGGHVGSVPHVDVHETRLSGKIPRLVHLLVDETVEERSVQRHIVDVQQRRPVQKEKGNLH
jgi:hypothetical protein